MWNQAPVVISVQALSACEVLSMSKATEVGSSTVGRGDDHSETLEWRGAERCDGCGFRRRAWGRPPDVVSGAPRSQRYSSFDDPCADSWNAFNACWRGRASRSTYLWRPVPATDSLGMSTFIPPWIPHFSYGPGASIACGVLARKSMTRLTYRVKTARSVLSNSPIESDNSDFRLVPNEAVGQLFWRRQRTRSGAPQV